MRTLGLWIGLALCLYSSHSMSNPTPGSEINTTSSLVAHLASIPDSELLNVIQRGDKSLGSCAIRKSAGSSFCKFRLLNPYGSILCFNNDANFPVVGVVRGSWSLDPILKKVLTDHPNETLTVGSTITNPKDYFSNVRVALSDGAPDAQSKLLKYVKNYLLVPANPCGISIDNYAPSSTFDINNRDGFVFYKNPISKEIFCKSATLKNPTWDAIHCQYNPDTQQFFDPKWCKKLYHQLSAKSVVPVVVGGVRVPVNQIQFAPFGPEVASQATIQLFPPAFGQMIEDASTKVAIYDLLEPAVIAVAEYTPSELSDETLVNGPNLINFQKFYSAVSNMPTTIHAPAAYRTAKENLATIPTFVTSINTVHSVNPESMIAAKVKILQDAEQKVKKVVRGLSSYYSPQFSQTPNCVEPIMSAQSQYQTN